MASKSDKAVVISPTMKDCLRLALDKGGKCLHRWQGGFWTYAQQGSPEVARSSFGAPETYFGTSTIQALIDRGLLDVAESRTGRSGTFPIAVRLNHLSFEALK